MTTSTAQDRAKSTNAKAEAPAGNTQDQAQAISEAIEQMKAATQAIYQAFGSVGSASGDIAKLKVVEGKAKAQALGAKAENSISEKPLMSVGIAFAAGWLASRLLKS